MKEYFYILGGGIIIYIVYLFTKEKNILPKSSDKTATASVFYNTQTKIYQRFYEQLENILNNYNLSLNIEMPLAVINTESNLLFQTKINKQIIGDDGRSIGYMQASINAVKDVNTFFRTPFTFQNLYDEKFNLIIGTLYLDLCYRSAKNQNSKNPVRLAFKKYNGGIDETDNSKNAMAEVYAEKTYNNYLKFKEFM